MTRYYTRGFIPTRSFSVEEILHSTFVLLWDNKKKAHSFMSLACVEHGIKCGWETCGEPVAFECPEHEKEFLDFHPAASVLRREYRHGYWYATLACACSEAEFPLEKRRGRWCWKKA